MKKIHDNFLRKLSSPDILSELAEQLSASELNSLLLELFRLKTARISPKQVIQQFSNNRFVQPSALDPIALKELEITWLRFAKINHFQPVLLSPLSPLGTCSTFGKVDQYKIVSAVRGTEVVSDATNVLALKIAQDIRKKLDKEEVLRYAAVHQHMRAQHYDNPAFKAHFDIFCMVSGAFDKGNYQTEWDLFSEQLELCYELLARYFDHKDLLIRFYIKQDIPFFKQYLDEALENRWQNRRVTFASEKGTSYYEVIQFKIFLTDQDQEMDLADGGFVNWTQQLLSNRKHRLFTSGVSIERVLTLQQ